MVLQSSASSGGGKASLPGLLVPPALGGPARPGSNNTTAAPTALPKRVGAAPKGKNGTGSGMNTLALQKQLKAAGFDPGPLDGIWGPKTQAAYNAWKNSGGGSSGGKSGGSGTAPVGGGGGMGGAPSIMSGSTAPPAPESPSALSQIKPYAGKTAQQLADLAKASVDTQLNPLQSALDRQMTQGRIDYDRQNQDLTYRGQRGDASLAELTRRLGGFMANVQNEQDRAYGQAGAQTANLFNDLLYGLARSADAGVQRTSAEAARLGQQESVPAAIDGITDDGRYLMGRAAADRANALSNFLAQKNNFDSLFGMMRGNAETEGFSQRAKWGRTIEEGLQDLTQQFNDQQFELRGQYNDNEGKRGGLLQELMDKLDDREWSRRMEWDGTQFNQALALDKFGFEKSQAQKAAEAAQAQYDLDIAKLMADQQGGGSTKPTKYSGLGGIDQYLADYDLGPGEQQLRSYILQAISNSALNDPIRKVSVYDKNSAGTVLDSARKRLSQDGKMDLYSGFVTLLSILNGTYNP